MYTVGYIVGTLVVIVVVGAIVLAVSSVPDIRRYLRIRRM